MTLPPLRLRLGALANERRTLEEELRACRQLSGKTLLEVREDPDLTLTEAGSILGISKPTVYLLLHDAEETS